jgi:tetratricopeptide (TPR) repeat protein
MQPLQSPLDAYRSDLSRNPGRSDFGTSDTVWLLVAHCLHRLTRVPALARPAIASHCACALGDLAVSVDGGVEDGHLARALCDLRTAFDGFDAVENAAALSRVVRELTNRMSNAGALSLAFATIGHLRSVTVHAPARETGLNLAEQARIARCLGDLDGAEELYSLAADVGSAADVPEVCVRASLGCGVVARVRGNYPKARELFQLGLADAKEAGLEELAGIAHQGLLIAAAVAGDIDTALVHGWAALELAAGNEEKQMEMLINLAQLARDAGYPAAALRGFLSALTRTSVLRYRLSALGGAVVAASELGERGLVDRLRAVAEKDVGRSLLPYENAQVTRAISVALRNLGKVEEAETSRLRARTLAKKGGFFELVVATEPVTEPAPARRPRRLQPSSARVIESLEHMPADEAELVGATR